MQLRWPAPAQGAFDLLIVGGGIIGCGIARDAARRGLRTALVEREDFGAGTTSRSTRLIHGGLRYLEHGDLRLVREGLREREILLRIAPHLVQPLQFLTPIYAGDRRGPLMVRIGMALYDLLSWDKSLDPHQSLSAEAALSLEPALEAEGLRGAALYYDAQVALPERLAFENVMDAIQRGASAWNHHRACRFLTQTGRVGGVEVENTLTGARHELRARCVVNAAGPWADELAALADSDWAPQLRRTKGSHVVVPRFTERAVVLLARSDGRVFFTVPWRGFSLVGTTDLDLHEELDLVAASRAEVDYLLRETRRAFPRARLEPVYYTFSGVRALVREDEIGESQVSRKHRLFDHEEKGLAGLFSVLGGKITAYRSIAEEVVDSVVRQAPTRLLRAGRPVPYPGCETHRERLPGGEMESLEGYAAAQFAGHGSRLGLDREQVDRLVRTYGSRVGEVWDIAAQHPDLRARIEPDAPEILAQAVHAATQELALSTADVLLRRTGLGLEPGQGLAGARTVAGLLGQVFGWDDARIAQDADEYTRQIERREAWRPGPWGSP